MLPAPDSQTGAEPRRAVPRPGVTPSAWAALDADYAQPASPERLTQLPGVGFSGRFWHVDEGVPSDPRVRFERPALLAWLLISCLWQGLIAWAVMGLALIAYAGIARPAFRHYGLGARGWVYGAMGLGQLMLAASYVIALGPLWPFVGLYWLGVILTWILIELRTVIRQRHGANF